MSQGRFINVRKLAALDLHFRGAKVIIAEFGFVVFAFGGMGAAAVLLKSGDLTVDFVGVYLLILAIDYAPLLAYGVSIMRAGRAEEEAQPEASDPRVYRNKYGVQQALVMVPFVIPALAVAQEARKRERDGPRSP